MFTTQKQVREAFWSEYEDYQNVSKKKINNKYDTDTRCAFVDFVDYLHRERFISDKLANRVTL